MFVEALMSNYIIIGNISTPYAVHTKFIITAILFAHYSTIIADN